MSPTRTPLRLIYLCVGPMLFSGRSTLHRLLLLACSIHAVSRQNEVCFLKCALHLPLVPDASVDSASAEESCQHHLLLMIFTLSPEYSRRQRAHTLPQIEVCPASGLPETSYDIVFEHTSTILPLARRPIVILIIRSISFSFYGYYSFLPFIGLVTLAAQPIHIYE